jgi:hypothetical protein
MTTKLDDMMREPRDIALDLLDTLDDESDDNGTDMPTAFHEFLSSHEHGPKLDGDTIHLIHEGGVMDGTSFIAYSKQSFRDMLSPVSSRGLRLVNLSGLGNVKLYGTFLSDHDITAVKDISDFEVVDPRTYLIYWRSQRRAARTDAQEAVDLELAARVQAYQRRQVRLSSLCSSLGIADPTIPIMPEESPLRRGESMDVNTVRVGENTETPTANIDGNNNISDFARRLDYPDEDDEGLLRMVTPTKAELETPFDSEKSLLSPSLGRPSTDPAYKNRLQNPDSYGPTHAKPLAMINSKVQWNGKRSSFDETQTPHRRTLRRTWSFLPSQPEIPRHL